MVDKLNVLLGPFTTEKKCPSSDSSIGTNALATGSGLLSSLIVYEPEKKGAKEISADGGPAMAVYGCD